MNRRMLWVGFALVVLAGLAPAVPEKDGTAAILRRFSDEFVPLPPGQGRFPASFLMGGSSTKAPAAERPVVKVTFTRSFAVARYEVTQELYHAVMGGNPSRWRGPRNSVEKIDWAEATAFCRRATDALRQAKRIADNEEVRLPAEAEWEYACRAGTTTAYSFGDNVQLLRDYAWFDGNSKGEDPPVGRKKPNAWGLYDMHGYIWEWCQDAWHPTLEGLPADGSPRRQDGAKERVIRGGSWADPADSARSGYRGRAAAATRNDRIGFRCVKARVR